VTGSYRAIVLAATLLVVAAGDRGPTIRWTPRGEDPTRGGFEVHGLGPAERAALASDSFGPTRWAEVFRVNVDDGPADRPAILGSYKMVGDLARFVPRFPLERGLRYRAVFDPARLGVKGSSSASPIVGNVLLPKPVVAATTTVTHVTPTADRLPENLLKFYLHFSAPMARGEAYRRVRLLDAGGQPVRAPFLELSEELWDPNGTRFTVLLDPGRIKRGLKPREELGPILEQGKSYTLVIDRDWLDAEGQPLKESFRKTFRAGPPDDRPPDPKDWTIAPPSAGTVGPLVVTFPEPLDHALIGRLIGVRDAAGESVPGKVAVEAGETCWRFTPERRWRADSYRLVIDTALEDLAGNSVGRPFEVDAFEPIRRTVEAETVTRAFRPK
jgi:hypothetical protein